MNIAIEKLKKEIGIIIREGDKERTTILAEGFNQAIKAQALFGKFITVKRVNKIINRISCKVKHDIDLELQRLRTER